MVFDHVLKPNREAVQFSQRVTSHNFRLLGRQVPKIGALCNGDREARQTDKNTIFHPVRFYPFERKRGRPVPPARLEAVPRSFTQLLAENGDQRLPVGLRPGRVAR